MADQRVMLIRLPNRGWRISMVDEQGTSFGARGLPIAVPPLDGPELFIGIVGPLGVDLARACDLLKQELAGVAYETEVIRMSRLLQVSAPRSPDGSDMEWPEDERIHALMDAGDRLRYQARSGAALVHEAVNSVRAVRIRRHQEAQKSLHRTAYIFNSLKHPDEVKELRRVYGSQFVCISFYEPRRNRANHLQQRIERSRAVHCKDAHERALRLIDKDAQAIDQKFGQKVADTFPLADLFARGSSESEAMASDIRRAVRVIFGDPFCTPTRDEYCMFLARAAALRSADLSRQVGAVIATDRGDVLASGCNEVPRPGGGNYWADDVPDRRDFRVGRDVNVSRRRELIEQTFEVMRRQGWLSLPSEKSSAELAAEAMRNGSFDGSLVDNLIEYGRVVHAEMNALMDAVRRGVAVAGSALHCTTFPCHLCARHIIAAGVRRVVFIEPYPKSLVKDLYGDAVAIENEKADDHAVAFEPFVGVAPRSYMVFFGRERRKDPAGYAHAWPPASPQPHMKAYYESYLDIEQRLCDSLAKLSERREDTPDPSSPEVLPIGDDR